MTQPGRCLSLLVFLFFYFHFYGRSCRSRHLHSGTEIDRQLRGDQAIACSSSSFFFFFYMCIASRCRCFIVSPLFGVDPLLMYRSALPSQFPSLSLFSALCRLVVVDTQGDLGTSSPPIQPLLSASRVHRLDQIDV